MKNIALHILDLVENAARAKAKSVEVSISEDTKNDRYMLSIKDDGTGMNEEILQKAADPFFTSRLTRKVGLGLPLVKMNAERTGGSFSLDSVPGRGTKLEAMFKMSHPDRLPLGEIGDVMVLLTTGLPALHLVYEHKTPFGFYHFDTKNIRDIIGYSQDNNIEIRKFLREMVSENLKEIQAEE
ncbi:MAG: ATP-binding protein [Prolixibacteraceae bacterium]